MPTTSSPPEGKKFYLFGYPIAHSVAPTFHNLCFTNWSKDRAPNTYEIWSTSKVTEEMLDTLARDDCVGSAVTMPIKATILPYLDEVSPESQMTGACNTIVKVPTSTGYKLVGQNTDILGVRNALLRALRSQYPNIDVALEASYPVGAGAGIIIGGGATTRSAAHALTLLGLAPLFLVNRDLQEVQAVQHALRHLKIIHLRNPGDVEAHLGQASSPTVLMTVGAIPSTPPTTMQERMVYSTASTIFTIPYIKPTPIPKGLPIPERRIFLEMAYKPRVTPMLQVAVAHGWHGIDGIQAMIEQGLAQQRMWYKASASLEVGSDRCIFGEGLERPARELCERMGDITVVGEEIDKAKTVDSAKLPVVRL